MAWRSWSRENPCPVCSGWQWAGRSAEQCRGGLREDAPELAYCSTRESSAPREKTWLWVLNRPYAFQPEPPDPDPGPPTWERPASRAPRDLRHPAWRRSQVWDYQDEYANYAYSVVRFDRLDPGDAPDGIRLKEYRPGRRISPGSDLFRWGLLAEARLPYRLPELILALQGPSPVWVVEGEKSADALAALGHAATTMPGGSASWLVGSPERWLPPDRQYQIVLDRDSAGRGWAADVLRTCPRGVLWQSATTGEGDDVIDHLDAGYDLSELVPA